MQMIKIDKTIERKSEKQEEVKFSSIFILSGLER